MSCFFIFTKGAIMGMGSWWHWAIVIAVVLILFGGKKIPELMKGVGTGIKGFKKAIKDDDDDEADSAKSINSVDNANSNAKSTKQITQSTVKKRGRPKGATASTSTSSTKKNTTKSSVSKNRATKTQ